MTDQELMARWKQHAAEVERLYNDYMGGKAQEVEEYLTTGKRKLEFRFTRDPVQWPEAVMQGIAKNVIPDGWEYRIMACVGTPPALVFTGYRQPSAICQAHFRMEDF